MRTKSSFGSIMKAYQYLWKAMVIICYAITLLRVSSELVDILLPTRSSNNWSISWFIAWSELYLFEWVLKMFFVRVRSECILKATDIGLHSFYHDIAWIRMHKFIHLFGQSLLVSPGVRSGVRVRSEVRRLNSWSKKNLGWRFVYVSCRNKHFHTRNFGWVLK